MQLLIGLCFRRLSPRLSKQAVLPSQLIVPDAPNGLEVDPAEMHNAGDILSVKQEKSGDDLNGRPLLV